MLTRIIESSLRNRFLVILETLFAIGWGLYADRSPDSGVLDWSAFAGRLVFMPVFMALWYVACDWVFRRPGKGERR